MPKPKYRPECRCGACPRLPADRPPTLDECAAYWSHDGWFPEHKVKRLAVLLHVYSYASWVNTRGWRKPRGWTSGRVPLDKLRPKARPIFPDDCRRVAASMMRR